MLNAPIPDNDFARLAAVRETGLLDTENSARFDRYTRLAAHLFQVPIALISLVDESRVWYKSRFGFGPRETPRMHSLCSHAINGDGVLLIENAAEDDQFRNNPMVIGEPGIRFYAGHPLVSPHGYALGTLCAIDSRPRQFSDRAGEALQDIAEMVSAEIVSQQFAAVDPMTGLPNRRGFIAIAEHSVALCTRHSGHAALLLIELEGVDILEGQCLTVEGARAMQTFGRLLREAMRDSDVSARLIDNRFAVLLTDATMEQAWLCVERLRGLVNKRNGQTGTAPLNFCAGVAMYDPDRYRAIDDFIEAGDQALYRQKRSRARAAVAARSV